MRRPLVIAGCLALAGCRGLLGIDDPTLDPGDANITDVPTADAAPCTGADFDHDGTPDACDPCPMFASTTADHDRDGDGVGDGCDPNPDVVGDHRALWTGFQSPNDIAIWIRSGGTWAIDMGQLVQSDETATGRIVVPGSYDNAYLMTEMSVIRQGTSPQAGMCTNVATIGPSGKYRCCDVDSPTQPNLLTWDETAQVTTAWPGSLAPGQAFSLTENATAVQHACTVSQLLGTATGMKLSTGVNGVIVLHFRQIAVAYRYLFVVTPQP